MNDQKDLRQQRKQSRQDRFPAVQAARDTLKSFETSDLSPQVGHPPHNGHAPQNVTTGNRRANPPAEKSALAIDIADGLQKAVDSKQRVRKGLPSWLTSFTLHLFLMVCLALITASSGGKRMINLIGASEDAAQKIHAAEVEFELETLEVAAVATAHDILDEAPVELHDLAATLDVDATLLEPAEEITGDALFERIASSGINESDLPHEPAGGGGSGASFFGVDSQGTDFVFIVDCSGSMADFGRWHQAKKELRKSIKNLRDDQRFLVILYNDGYIAMNKTTELMQSTPSARRNAIRWLNRNHPSNWTFCAAALKKALSLQPDAIFLLSDGEFNDRNDVFLVLDEMNDLSQLRRFNRRQTPVHTVALGSHSGRFTMKQIAEENGGVFKLVD